MALFFIDITAIKLQKHLQSLSLYGKERHNVSQILILRGKKQHKGE